jgi:hypothetical protein
MAGLYCSGRVLAFRMRRGGRSGHASSQFDPGARYVASFHHDTDFARDTNIHRDTFTCCDAAGCIQPQASSGHDRIAADASASGGKDADQRSGAGKAAGTASSSQSSPRHGKSPGAHAARHATAHANTGADYRGCADQPVTIRWPYSRWRH